MGLFRAHGLGPRAWGLGQCLGFFVFEFSDQGAPPRD